MAGETLQVELQAYAAMLPELLRTHAGKFVVFKGDQFIGAWDTLDAAASNAVLQFGRGPYLIRPVGAQTTSLPASVLYNIQPAA